MVEYAVRDVMYLLRLKERLSEELGDLEGREVAEWSASFASYGWMNPHIHSQGAVQRQGRALQAMFATRN